MTSEVVDVEAREEFLGNMLIPGVFRSSVFQDIRGFLTAANGRMVFGVCASGLVHFVSSAS